MAPTASHWAALHESLTALPQIPIDDAVVRKAARWGFQCDRKGVTFSTTDLLIAAAAHGKATLVHRDGDFTRMAAMVGFKEEFGQEGLRPKTKLERKSTCCEARPNTTANLLPNFELARLFPCIKPPLSPFGKGG